MLDTFKKSKILYCFLFVILCTQLFMMIRPNHCHHNDCHDFCCSGHVNHLITKIHDNVHTHCIFCDYNQSCTMCIASKSSNLGLNPYTLKINFSFFLFLNPVALGKTWYLRNLTPYLHIYFPISPLLQNCTLLI